MNKLWLLITFVAIFNSYACRAMEKEGERYRFPSTLQSLKKALAENALYPYDSRGYSPLRAYANDGAIELAVTVIMDGADINEKKDKNTALDHALQNSQWNMAFILIGYGADTLHIINRVINNIPNYNDRRLIEFIREQSCGKLLLAVLLGNENDVKSFANGVSAKDLELALIYAVMQGNISATKILLTHDARASVALERLNHFRCTTTLSPAQKARYKTLHDFLVGHLSGGPALAARLDVSPVREANGEILISGLLQSLEKSKW